MSKDDQLRKGVGLFPVIALGLGTAIGVSIFSVIAPATTLAGPAMLLSVVGGLSTIASGGASVVLGGAGQSAAGVAAQQDSQIGPTVRVRQGEPIRVFTARDLDFSSVN